MDAGSSNIFFIDSKQLKKRASKGRTLQRGRKMKKNAHGACMLAGARVPDA